MSHQPNLPAIHDLLFTLALQAGTTITTTNPTEISTKKNSSDLVTETDRAVETTIATALKAAYPTYAFLGEETAPPSGTVPPGPCFIVDPIDGTTNFVHGHPYISISLCFALDRVPLVGIVYNPFTQHLYHAIRGHGAFLTAPTIPISQPPLPGQDTGSSHPVTATYACSRLPLRNPPLALPSLNAALVAIEWGNERSGANFAVKTRAFTALAAAPDVTAENGAKGKMVHGFRSLGSAALNCCAVARGDLDAYWEGGCWAWDVGAGWVVVEEAGGRVVGGNKGEWEIGVDGRRYLVVRGCGGGEGEQRRIIEEVWDAVGDGKLVYD